MGQVLPQPVSKWLTAKNVFYIFKGLFKNKQIKNHSEEYVTETIYTPQSLNFPSGPSQKMFADPRYQTLKCLLKEEAGGGEGALRMGKKTQICNKYILRSLQMVKLS